MYGVGDVTVAQLMAEIGDARNYPRRSSIVVFAGIDPEVNQSGKMNAESDLSSKRGSPHLRKTLYQIMTTYLRLMPQNEPVYQFLDKKRTEGEALLHLHDCRCEQVSAHLLRPCKGAHGSTGRCH